MANIDWYDFIVKYRDREKRAFKAIVSVTIPDNITQDLNGKTLLAPYELFVEWCNAYLVGEWSTNQNNGDFYVCVLNDEDCNLINAEFTNIISNKSTIAGSKTSFISYGNSEYAALAGDLGYVIAIK